MEKNNNEHKHPMSPKKIVLFVLYALIAVFLFFTVLSFNDFPSIIAQLKELDTGYLLLAILMVIIHLITFPISLCVLAKAEKIDVKPSTTYTIAMTEHFFNGITPLASGGQPFQAHFFSKAKLKLSDATGLVFTNLLTFMLATNGLSLISLIYFNDLMRYIDTGWIPIIIIGYVLNFSLVGITFAVGMSARIRGWILKLLHAIFKIKLFSKAQAQENRICAYFERVQSSIRYIMSKKKYFLSALFAKVFSYICLYGSSFFILLGLDIPVNISHFPLVMLGTSFAITAVGFFPTPGASGGVEGLARQVYESIIVFACGGIFIDSMAAQAGGVMLIFRLLSYYMIMIISLAFYIGLEVYFKKQKNKEVALESEHINEAESGENNN